jgi:hypothetical protein
MSSFVERASWRAAGACALFIAGSVLAGCDGPPSSTLKPLELTTAGVDDSTAVGRGDAVAFKFTVTNPGHDTVEAVAIAPIGDDHLQTQGVTCTAQGGTCPVITGLTLPTFTMPPGAVLTFAVQAVVVGDLDGTVKMTFAVDSYQRTGEVRAVAQAPSVDRRDGYYEIFTSSGVRSNLVVNFKPDATSFSVSSGSNDKTFQSGGDWYKFPSGGHFSSGPDLLAGQADFGNGPDTFIAVRNLVDQLSDLDGISFSTFNLVKGAAASASDPISGTDGPFDIWQVAIAGATLTVCTQQVGPIAACAAGQLRHYALTEQAGGGPVFTATDTVDNDTFTFQVARSGTSLIYLRADVAPADALFSIGFGNATAPAAEHDGYGTLASGFGVLTVVPTFWSFLAQNPAGDFGPSTDNPYAGGDDGIGGLVHGARPGDGVEAYFLQQGVLSVFGTLTGEFGVAVDRGA